MKGSFSTVLVFVFLVFCVIKSEVTKLSFPTSCNNLEDGFHYILPFSADAMSEVTSEDSIITDKDDWDESIFTMTQRDAVVPIKVYCNNGYTIINYYEDNNVVDYFSSYHQYLKEFGGPDLNDHVSFEDWWLPSRYYRNYEDKDIIWSVTYSDCTQCLDPTTLELGSQTGFYMTPEMGGCNWATKIKCSYDKETLECYDCPFLTTTRLAGKCGHLELSVTSHTTVSHTGCTEETNAYGENLPSISLTGKYCFCYKIDGDDNTYIELETDDELYSELFDEKVETEKEAKEKIFDNDVDRVVYLSQEDFEEGTYRISKPGTYKLTEDIIMSPHSISYDEIYTDGKSPNAYGAWSPYEDQADDYPGAADYDGWYWIGFFAAITIESSDVVIDLNDFTIQMDYTFYVQQRWFVNIEIGNKPFSDSDGPTWTGAGQITGLENIVIKNGVLGLSSHIGIHANQCHNVKLENLIVKEFETHGIVFNGYSNVEFNNVEVGPSTRQLGVNGNYNTARMLINIFYDSADDIGDENIRFFQRPTTTYSELVTTLIYQMDLVFKYVVYNDLTVKNDSQWDAAERLFVSDIGVSRAGTIYGLSFRTNGQNVFSYGRYLGGRSYDLRLNNVYIHDLEIQTEEIISVGLLTTKNQINGPLPLQDAASNKFQDLATATSATYVGNALSDVLLALRSLSNNWWYLNRLACDSEICEGWAMMGNPIRSESSFQCGYDSLAHICKGSVGIKFEGSDNVNFKNVTIENIKSLSPLGTDLCGNWSVRSDGLQFPWVVKGYNAPSATGIVLYNVTNMTFDDVKISNVMSYYGPAYGYYSIILNKNGKLRNNEISNILGGLINEDDYSYDHLPNIAAHGCAVELKSYHSDLTAFYSDSDIWSGHSDLSEIDNEITTDENLQQYCISGHTGCISDTEAFSTLTSSYYNPTSCTEQSFSFADGKTVTVDASGNVVKIEQGLTYFQQFLTTLSTETSVSTSASKSK